MANDVRDRMIDGAMRSLARRGLNATSFSEVLAATGAPRGSLYHHFPGGKTELVGAAIDRAGALLSDALSHVVVADVEGITQQFLSIWRAVLTRGECTSGCAVLALAVDTDSPDLLGQAATVFRAWRVQLSWLLQAAGLSAADAHDFALWLVASVEGAVVLSRAERSSEPFEIVANRLVAEATRLQSGRAGSK